MFDVFPSGWTSRDEVGERLLPKLAEPGVAGLRAARLLSFLAPRSLAASLTSLALDRDQRSWHRIYALRALARAGAGLSEESLARLLDEVFADEPAAPIACGALFPTTPPGRLDSGSNHSYCTLLSAS